MPRPDPALLRAEAARLMECVGPAFDEGVLRLTVTRGPGGRGYRPPPAPSPTRILSLYAAPRPARTVRPVGVALTVCRTRFGDSPGLAGIKHLNRLEQVLAQSEWDDPRIFDGLMLDQRGRVISGTRSNLFVLTDEGLVTPALERCGIAGTARATVLERCTVLGIPVAECEVPWRVLSGAPGLFVTNALVGLLPVSRIDALRFDPRAVPAALIEQVREAVFMPEASC